MRQTIVFTTTEVVKIVHEHIFKHNQLLDKRADDATFTWEPDGGLTVTITPVEKAVRGNDFQIEGGDA